MIKRLLFIWLVIIYCSTVIGQSEYSEGLYVGKTGNAALIDSIVESGGLIHLYSGGAPYYSYNADSIQRSETIAAGDGIMVRGSGTTNSITTGRLLSELTTSLNLSAINVTTLESDVDGIDIKSEFDSVTINATLDTVFAYYTAPSGQLKIRWPALSTQDNRAPTATSALITDANKHLLVITMSEYVLDSIIEDPGGVPNTDSISTAFTVNSSIGSFTVDSVTVATNKVTLILSDSMWNGSVVTVDYDKPVTYGLRDAYDNYTISFSGLSVTNNADTTTIYDKVINNHWDFESETLGTFDMADMTALFGTLYRTGWHATPSIVSKTINGVARNVLEIVNEAGYPTEAGWYSGLDITWGLGATYNEAYYSYNFMIGKDVSPLSDNKMPGYITGPVDVGNSYPDPGDGFRAQGYFKYGTEFNSYVYSRTHPTTAQLDFGTPDLDSVYLVPGVWYSITIRVVVNDYNLYNGLMEVAINGEWKNQSDGIRFIEDYGFGIDRVGINNYTGGSGASVRPIHDFHTYVSDLNVWAPLNDNEFGTNNLHNASHTFVPPDSIVDRDFDYDELIRTEVILTNAEFGGSYSPGLEEQYLLDGGPLGAFSVEFNSNCYLGSNDYLFVYDGDNYDATMIAKYNSQSIPSGTTLSSSDRYLFFRFSSANSGGGNGWSVDITRNEPKIAGLGDSHSYSQYNTLISMGYDLTNMAYPGWKIADADTRWDTYSAGDKLAFDYVLYAVGTNDCVTGYPVTNDIIYDHIDLLAKIKSEVSASCQIIMFTMVHVLSPIDFDPVSQSDMVVLKAVNEWIRTVPTNVDVVSTANTDDLSLGDYLNPLYADAEPDALHFNTAGKAIFLQNLIDVIE